MSKALVRVIDMKQIAVSLGWKEWRVRKWMWKLDIEPGERRMTVFRTRKGKRIAYVSMYDKAVVEQIREASK